MKEKEFINFVWAMSLLSIVIIICGTLLWINHNSWTLRFEMDDNTKEAIESVEYPIVNEEKNYVNICRIFNDSTADCGVGGVINPDVIEIYGDCKYKWMFREDGNVQK